MKELKRQEYKHFIEMHILRPLGDPRSDLPVIKQKLLRYSDETYNNLPQWFEKYPSWTKEVKERINKYYSSVERGYFPDDDTGLFLFYMINHKYE